MNDDDFELDKEFIPETLHYLIPFVEKWCCEITLDEAKNLLDTCSDQELDEIIESLTRYDRQTFIHLDNWLTDPREGKYPSEEYLKFSDYSTLFDSAVISKEERNE